ncbi:rhodanese-like domain-containing protein [Beggiatoa leptomitoformis]|uniref:Rhodanese-like domain-containing protein n=1 Tax=Beggiatoa leptomitoformis TaxID=288004 RepID=A0A2N9YHP7_9GAMM|nr:rhodanese-like domain-containing protein [Beggiatoa leptomitoformis]ALG67703.1 rhodanese-like domain-containing protein [Beggiatoa leptomitoformis]AUI70058.1 rhodanese-like domain-containing protein [Beggiatoa leptomitoformis]
MGQLMEFVGNHPFLFIALFVVTGMLAWHTLNSLQGGVSLQPQEVTMKINHDDAIVVDVREESEYIQGHIINSLHIPLGSLEGKLNRLEKYRSRPIVVSCMSGQRSASAVGILKKNGFENVYNLGGGIMAWQNANLPVTKGKESKEKLGTEVTIEKA